MRERKRLIESEREIKRKSEIYRRRKNEREK